MSAPHEPTSERVEAPDVFATEDDYRIYVFHLATYGFAARYLAGGAVLDYGCGTGYGSHRIAEGCRSVVGVDVSAAAIASAAETYAAENLRFQIVAPVEHEPLPFADGSFDAVLSFQVIEHVADPHLYLREASRVLTDQGILIVATPERSSRLFPGQRPWNRFHRTEYSSAALRSLLSQHFGSVEISGMSGESKVVQKEFDRSRRTKWMTLPFTFPGAPEPWRQFGLRELKNIQGRLQRGHQAPEAVVEEDSGGARRAITPKPTYGYDESAVRIGTDVSPSTNIVAVCHKSR